MINKLEVGMYVRTDNGIAKLIESRHFENETGNYNYLVTDKEIKKAIYDDQKNEHIIKASHNIIDLIEVGDYVNGHQVYEVDRECHRITLNGGDIGEEFRFTYLRPALGKNMGIKSVVTKEQFEEIQYVIK